MNSLNPFTSSTSLELPEIYKNVMHGLINIQNIDDKSLQYFVARHFCRDEKHNCKVTRRLKDEVDKLNWNKIPRGVK